MALFKDQIGHQPYACEIVMRPHRVLFHRVFEQTRALGNGQRKWLKKNQILVKAE